MWAPEEYGPASERLKDAARHIQYLGGSTLDPNCCWNQRQGNFQHPVGYLQCLSKVQLLTQNTRAPSGSRVHSPQVAQMQSGRRYKSTQLHPLQLELKVVKHVWLGKLGKDGDTALQLIAYNQS